MKALRVAVATIMVSVVVGITGTPATDPALAVHGPDWTPWATTTITVAYNAHITVTWTHDSDGTTITKTCVLVQGHNDESSECVSDLADVLVDQAYSQKPAFNEALRKASLNVHRNYPRPDTEGVKTSSFAQRGNRAETVICNAGWMLHKWTPEHLHTIPPDMSQADRKKRLTARLRWTWRPHEYYDDGSIRFECPFCTGHLTNEDLSHRTPRKTVPGALLGPVPPGETRCCNGSFVAFPKELLDFQQPLWGTDAHTTLMGKRNAVEGTFGVLKNKGAFRPETCRAAGLVPHAMSALMAAVVHNLQTGIEEEYRRQVEHSANKLARQAATERRRRDNQEPTGSRSQPHQTVNDTDIDEGTRHVGSPPSATKARASRAPP